jgi:hypothetical protein
MMQIACHMKKAAKHGTFRPTLHGDLQGKAAFATPGPPKPHLGVKCETNFAFLSEARTGVRS